MLGIEEDTYAKIVIKHLTQGFHSFKISIQNQLIHNSSTYYLLKTWYKLLDADYELDNKPEYNSFLGKSEFIVTLENWKEEILHSFLRPYEDRKQSNALAKYRIVD